MVEKMGGAGHWTGGGVRGIRCSISWIQRSGWRVG